jgi:hypothetical protein
VNQVFRAKNYQPSRSAAEIELEAKVMRLESRVGELDFLMKRQRMQYAKVCKQLQQAARKV